MPGELPRAAPPQGAQLRPKGYPRSPAPHQHLDCVSPLGSGLTAAHPQRAEISLPGLRILVEGIVFSSQYLKTGVFTGRTISNTSVCFRLVQQPS